jgi:hypothetical protein
VEDDGLEDGDFGALLFSAIEASSPLVGEDCIDRRHHLQVFGDMVYSLYLMASLLKEVRHAMDGGHTYVSEKGVCDLGF